MGDQLENFIVENKQSFDSGTPNDRLWSKIEGELQPEKKSYGFLWKIAAVVFLGSTLFLFQDKLQGEDAPQFSQEFVEAESYYTQLISEKKNEIKQVLNKEDGEVFLEEINELDALYDHLREDYSTNTTNDRIVDAMIYNLQLRLEILNKQIDILERIKEQKDENGEIEI